MKLPIATIQISKKLKCVILDKRLYANNAMLKNDYTKKYSRIFSKKTFRFFTGVLRVRSNQFLCRDLLESSVRSLGGYVLACYSLESHQNECNNTSIIHVYRKSSLDDICSQ
uniref:Uncharacterized protein n=1 Tax=Trichobilharzia regenti TaxID=157069 RepID=A0AA85J6P1_TRIRE|nr:unnamed protein product [Trichobilharzia regenti]